MNNKKVTFNKKKLEFSVISIITFLGIETIARMYNWYENFVIYDLISHLLFGIAFYSFIWIFLSNKVKLNFKDYSFFYLFIALGWELLEKIGDNIFSSPNYLKDIFFFDGLSDVIIGFIGLYIANEILKKK